MIRRLPSLLVTACLASGAVSLSLLPRVAVAQAAAPAQAAPAPQSEARPATPPPARVAVPPEAPARASPTRAASNRKPAPADAPAPAAAPPAPPPVQAVEYTFLRREDPEVDLAQLQQLGVEGWQVVATVVVDGSTRRYVLMRPKR